MYYIPRLLRKWLRIGEYAPVEAIVRPLTRIHSRLDARHAASIQQAAVARAKARQLEQHAAAHVHVSQRAHEAREKLGALLA